MFRVKISYTVFILLENVFFPIAKWIMLLKQRNIYNY